MTGDLQVVDLDSISLIVYACRRLSLNHPMKLGGLCTILHGYEVKLEITLIGYPCMAIACMQVYFILIVGIPVKC